MWEREKPIGRKETPARKPVVPANQDDPPTESQTFTPPKGKWEAAMH